MNFAELLSQVLANQQELQNTQEDNQDKIIEMQEISPDTWAMVKK